MWSKKKNKFEVMILGRRNRERASEPETMEASPRNKCEPSQNKTKPNKNKTPYRPCSKQFTRVSQPFRVKVRLTVLILAVMPVGGGIP